MELKHRPLQVGFLLLTLLELPLDPVDQVLPWPHGLELVVPLHSVPFKSLHASPVVSKDLSQVHALIRFLRGGGSCYRRLSTRFNRLPARWSFG